MIREYVILKRICILLGLKPESFLYRYKNCEKWISRRYFEYIGEFHCVENKVKIDYNEHAFILEVGIKLLQECIYTIESSLGHEELKKLSRILNDLYNPFLLDEKVWTIIEDVLPEEVYNKIKHFNSSLLGHSVVNDLVIKNFPGESTIKYHFIKNYLNRSDEVSTFELNVGASRLDIGRINGKSIAYEIKTELDSLEKLDKQIKDYSKVFEYVYVIIHPCHYEKVLDMLPMHCGIITYNLSGDKCKFAFRKKADKNYLISPIEQLKVLNKKELDWILRYSNCLNCSTDKQDKIDVIIDNYSAQKINLLFKKVLKNRYNNKWGYLCVNFFQILPIDIQTFFTTQADPYWIYYKNSSIV